MTAAPLSASAVECFWNAGRQRKWKTDLQQEMLLVVLLIMNAAKRRWFRLAACGLAGCKSCCFRAASCAYVLQSGSDVTGGEEFEEMPKHLFELCIRQSMITEKVFSAKMARKCPSISGLYALCLVWSSVGIALAFAQIFHIQLHNLQRKLKKIFNYIWLYAVIYLTYYTSDTDKNKQTKKQDYIFYPNGMKLFNFRIKQTI